MSGTPLPPFRRRFELRRIAADAVEAELEDHIHHVVVIVHHDHHEVTGVEGRAIRLPWSLCPGAISQLEELVGAPVGVAPAVADAGTHCTHLLESALTAVRFAGTTAGDRRYDLEVTDVEGDAGQPSVLAVARRDDGFELTLHTDGRQLLAPSQHAGQSLGAGFAGWAATTLDPDQAEAAILLRRAVWMRVSVAIDLDTLDVLADSGIPEGACYSSQPARIRRATRNRGSSLAALPER